MKGSGGVNPHYIMVIGIDHGNSQIKTLHTVFTAGITTHGQSKPPMSAEVVHFEGNYYSISSTRSDYMRDKTENIDYFILTLFAIAKELKSSAEYQPGTTTPIDLAVGLPPEHFGTGKESFIKYFYSHGKDLTFEYNDEPFHVIINDVFNFPQAYAAITTRANKFKEYSKTYIVDIGGYTVDVILLNHGIPDLQVCKSFELGLNTFGNIIKGLVNSNYGKKIDDTHITDVLLGNKTLLPDDIKNLITSEAHKHVDKIFNQLREIGIDLTINPAIFVGGGSLVLKPIIENSPKLNPAGIEFIPEVSANAIGYTYLAQGALRKKNR